MTDPSPPVSPLRALVGVFVIAAIVAGVASTFVFVVLDRYDGNSIEVISSGLPTIAVDVRGAVATPGVVVLPSGARLVDAIAASGGLAPDADDATLNLAARVGDGEVVTIPAETPATPVQTHSPSIGGNPQTGLVNINTATAAELEALPGIGPVIGERIVAYREANGPFQSVNALTAVDGISDTMLETLRPLVTVDG
jgi:competence protein ComEA